MEVAITGTSSGVGKCLSTLLKATHNVFELTRNACDLDYPDRIESLPFVDMLINCAGHDLGGKVPFSSHNTLDWQKIISANLVSPMTLSQLAIRKNSEVIIVNITSTNNDKFWPGDLVYSLSKKALEDFGNMLSQEHPNVTVKEVRLGLTKTNFNNNRHKPNHKSIDNLYDNQHLLPEDVAEEIYHFIFSADKFLRLAP